jgi:hypothetical protein
MQIHHLADVFPSLVFGWRHVPEKGITSKEKPDWDLCKVFLFHDIWKAQGDVPASATNILEVLH